MIHSRTLTKSLLSAAICTIVAAVGASAAPVTWGTPTTISADTDIATTGTLERAYNFGQNPNAPTVAATTINGVTFDPFGVSQANGTNTVTLGNTVLSSTSFIRGFAPFGTGTGLSAAYGELLTQGFFTSANNSPVTLTLNGLTIGHSYLVQFFVQDSRSFGAGTTVTIDGAVTLDYNNTNAAGGNGQFVVGEFTADSTSQAFTFVPSANAIINGFQLRTTAVPEPSSVVLLALSGAAIFGVARLRRTRS